MVNRVVVGAHYGLRDWLSQRITAVIMIVYAVAMVAALICLPKDYQAWRLFFGTLWIQIFTQITVLALLLHAWVGIRDLWMDYVKATDVRLLLHVCTILWLLACLIYSIKVIWGIGA